MKSYLLGTLDEREAEAIELQYFSDPRFLEWIKGVEQQLISEYFEGQLPSAQKELFEDRYRLKIPELRQIHERTYNRQPTQSAPSTGLAWNYAWGALAVIIIAASSLVVWRLRPHPPAPTSAVTLAIHLTPGIVKGAARPAEFTQPQNGRVRFTLELPGRTSPVDCRVALAAVDNQTQAIWTSGPLRSRDQQLNVEIESRLLVPGDYLIRALTLGGDVMESYFVRVLTSASPGAK